VGKSGHTWSVRGVSDRWGAFDIDRFLFQFFLSKKTKMVPF
jgi:hypothetical protein